MHIRPVAGQSEREVAYQPAQILVRQSRISHEQRRLRGHLSSQAATGFLPRNAGDRLVADLSVPRAAGPDEDCKAERRSPYDSMTSSARARIDGGIVRPSALAVFR